MRISRRSFLAGSAGAVSYLCARRSIPSLLAAPKAKPQPDAIKHIIVVTMENRSFDHWLGWLPDAEGMQAGLTYTDANGIAFPTHPLAPDFTGCGHVGPDNSFDGGRIEYDNGACDGWLLVNDTYSIGYYTQADEAFFGQAAPQWTVCDNYFASIMAPTTPNRMYMHAGVTDRLDDSLTLSTLPTIWDRLAERQLPGRYYFSDTPFLALWGTKYAGITRPYAQFLADCASGELPAVSYVDPPFLGESQGTSDDDHPFADIRAGEFFLSQTYHAVTTSPAWKHTAMIINFDEWGGFFDHVAPTTAPDVSAQLSLRGFRVPCMIISPFARRGFVSSELFDHTSILKMIETRFGLAPLSVRDANANNMIDALDLTSTNLAAPSYAVPPFVSTGC